MKIGIVLPTWNVPKEFLVRNLFMIENQIYDRKKHQIEIYLVVDDQKDYTNIIKNFKNVIVIFNKYNIGGPRSRNKGMMAAYKNNCDYVTFIDRDDSFFSFQSLLALIKAAENSKADIIIGRTLWEYQPYNFKILKQDNLWICGCMYSCKFLYENKIFFPKNPHNMDIAFNFWCNCINNIKKYEIEDIVYSYNYYAESDNHINNNDFKGNNARQLMENYSEIFPYIKKSKNYNINQAKNAIREWFLKYYLVLSTEEYDIGKKDLWRALPSFVNIFSELLCLNDFPWDEYKIIYKQINWNANKNEIPLFSIMDFIQLIKNNYCPEII